MDTQPNAAEFVWAAEIRLTVYVPKGWTESDEEDLATRLQELSRRIQDVAKSCLPENVEVAAALV